MITVERTYENYSNMTLIHLISYNIFKRKSNTIWKFNINTMIVMHFSPDMLTTEHKTYYTNYIRIILIISTASILTGFVSSSMKKISYKYLNDLKL